MALNFFNRRELLRAAAQNELRLRRRILRDFGSAPALQKHVLGGRALCALALTICILYIQYICASHLGISLSMLLHTMWVNEVIQSSLPSGKIIIA